ncbi:hypothetical protein LCGC14_0972530, partial [marine sediment metagenome]
MELTEKQKIRFWGKVKKTNSCWMWVATLHAGYGYVGLNGKDYSAHRISWEIHFGKIPEGMLVLHKCDNPPCVNPKHLWIGTRKQNTQDMIKKGRATP